MRIWHKKLIPLLCRQHLLACWREALGAYSIITNHKEGYKNHPAVKEFKDAPEALYARLHFIRQEMLNRGYQPKPLPEPAYHLFRNGLIHQWQTLKEQVTILKEKHCNCQVHQGGVQI